MQITTELDSQHLDKLHSLEVTLKKSPSDLIALAIDEMFKQNTAMIVGEKLLNILKDTRYLGSLPDNFRIY